MWSVVGPPDMTDNKRHEGDDMSPWAVSATRLGVVTLRGGGHWTGINTFFLLVVLTIKDVEH